MYAGCWAGGRTWRRIYTHWGGRIGRSAGMQSRGAAAGRGGAQARRKLYASRSTWGGAAHGALSRRDLLGLKPHAQITIMKQRRTPSHACMSVDCYRRCCAVLRCDSRCCCYCNMAWAACPVFVHAQSGPASARQGPARRQSRPRTVGVAWPLGDAQRPQRSYPLRTAILCSIRPCARPCVNHSAVARHQHSRLCCPRFPKVPPSAARLP